MLGQEMLPFSSRPGPSLAVGMQQIGACELATPLINLVLRVLTEREIGHLGSQNPAWGACGGAQQKGDAV